MTSIPSNDELVIAKAFVAYVEAEFDENDLLMFSDEQEFILETATINLIRMIRANPQLPQ